MSKAWARLARAGFLVVFLAACSDGDQASQALPTVTALPQDTGVDFSGDLLATTNRSILSVCVDGTPGYALTQDDLDAVTEALDRGFEGLAGPDAVFNERYGEDTRVIQGCPTPTVTLGATLASKEVSELTTRSFDAASPHRMFVYLVAPLAFDVTFPEERPFVRGAAEMLCRGDQCAEVTTALYVKSDIDPDPLTEALLYSLGLREPGSEPRS